MLTQYEGSIAKTKIAAFEQPPIGRVLTTKNEERRIVPVRDSFATVQELELRRFRMHSLLKNSGFLLINEPKTMGMPSQEVLQKFRAGLKIALLATERFSEFAADPSLHESQAASASSPGSDNTTIVNDLNLGPFVTDNTDVSVHIAQLGAQFRQLAALRRLQAAYLRKLPSRDLAWVLTLAQGAAKGYARYCRELLKKEPGVAHARIMAFAELVLRSGASIIWAFVRGSSSMGSSVRRAVWQVADEVLSFEDNFEIDGQKIPDGLHMTIVEELRQRLVGLRRARAAAEGQEFDQESVDARAVWAETHAFVGREIGWKDWNGYDAVADQ